MDAHQRICLPHHYGWKLNVDERLESLTIYVQGGIYGKIQLAKGAATAAATVVKTANKAVAH